MLSEKNILNETKNHNPPFKLNGRSLRALHFWLRKKQKQTDSSKKFSETDIIVVFCKPTPNIEVEIWHPAVG